MTARGLARVHLWVMASCLFHPHRTLCNVSNWGFCNWYCSCYCRKMLGILMNERICQHSSLDIHSSSIVPMISIIHWFGFVVQMPTFWIRSHGEMGEVGKWGKWVGLKGRFRYRLAEISGKIPAWTVALTYISSLGSRTSRTLMNFDLTDAWCSVDAYDGFFGTVTSQKGLLYIATKLSGFWNRTSKDWFPSQKPEPLWLPIFDIPEWLFDMFIYVLCPWLFPPCLWVDMGTYGLGGHLPHVFFWEALGYGLWVQPAVANPKLENMFHEVQQILLWQLQKNIWYTLYTPWSTQACWDDGHPT